MLDFKAYPAYAASRRTSLFTHLKGHKETRKT